MLEFILKSGACMAIFLLFYKLLLEEENMHVFKRFYLLGSLVASLVIPLLVFTEYVEVTPTSFITESNPIIIQQDTEDIINISPVSEADVIDFAPIVWGVYFIGLFFFGLKFIRNLFQIFRRIRRNPKYKLNQFTQVLLQEKITPHTFFSYIFLNKTKFESKQIPKEVLLHEETHAQQKHSLDVVFVELLQVIFWVNPLIYLAKKAIKLNHEFLADQAVLQKNIDETTYKNTLLSYVSPDSEKKYQYLANAINYSSIKKRFTIMKTHTSKKAILLRSLLVLPLLALMLYGFSETNIVQVEPEQEQFIDSDINYNSESSIISNIKYELKKINAFSINYSDEEALLIAETINIHITKTGNILVQDQLVAIENTLKTISKYNSDLSKEEKSKIVSATIHIETGAPQKTIRHIQEVLVEYGSATINIVNWNKSEDSERIWITIMNDNEIWLKDKKIELIDLTKELSSISSSQEVENKLKIQIYSEETLHQNFLNKVLTEIKKVKIKSIQVFTEKYIMAENGYLEKVDSENANIHLKANKMMIEYTTTPVIVNINKHGQLLVDDTLMDIEGLKKFLLKINPHLNEEEKNQSIHAKIFISVDSPEYIINKVYKILSNYGNTTIQPMEEDFFKKTNPPSMDTIFTYNSLAKRTKFIPNNRKNNIQYLKVLFNEMSNSKKEKVESPNSVIKYINQLDNLTTEQIKKVNEVLERIKSQSKGRKFYSADEYKEIENLYASMISGKKQISEVQASPKQLAEYNALAKKYNAMLTKSQSVQIKMKDVERLEYIYSLMSEKQKAGAEPFPNFPPMPESPSPPKAPKVKKGEKSNIPPPPPSTPNNEETKLLEEEAKLIEQEILIQKEASKLKEQAVLLEKQKSRLKEHKGKLIVNEEALQNIIKNQEIIAFENVQVYQHNVNGSKFSGPNILEYTQSLAKQDAQFYLNGKKVSTKQGLQIIQNNKNIRVETHPYTNKKAEVRIHTNQNDASIQAPNPTTPPKSPIDHVIGMAKKDAIFYYEGKEITSDKAIEIMKNNKEINIDSRTSNGKKPIVKLSVEPFTLDR